jgi:hypothetical protein
MSSSFLQEEKVEAARSLTQELRTIQASDSLLLKDQEQGFCFSELFCEDVFLNDGTAMRNVGNEVFL